MRAFCMALAMLFFPISVVAQPNAYGPGINSDATGRPFTWEPLPGNGPADPFSRVRPNAYGPGIGMDQYGRPVQATPFPPVLPGSRNPAIHNWALHHKS